MGLQDGDFHGLGENVRLLIFGADREYLESAIRDFRPEVVKCDI